MRERKRGREREKEGGVTHIFLSTCHSDIWFEGPDDERTNFKKDKRWTKWKERQTFRRTSGRYVNLQITDRRINRYADNVLKYKRLLYREKRIIEQIDRHTDVKKDQAKG